MRIRTEIAVCLAAALVLLCGRGWAQDCSAGQCSGGIEIVSFSGTSAVVYAPIEFETSRLSAPTEIFAVVPMRRRFFRRWIEVPTRERVTVRWRSH